MKAEALSPIHSEEEEKTKGSRKPGSLKFTEGIAGGGLGPDVLGLEGSVLFK